MDVGNGKSLHELMAQMLGKTQKVEEDNVIGKQDTEIKIDKNVKDANQEAIDTANIIKSAPTREDPNKPETEKDEENVDGIADGILVVTDPEITSEEFEEVADELQGIVDNTDVGELPFTDKYEGDYILSCPICGGTFVNDTLLDSGEDTCPICCKVPDSFVVNGRVENTNAVTDKEEVQDNIEHEENLEEPVDIENQESLEEPEMVEDEEENSMRKESKQIEGKKLQEDAYDDYVENEKSLAKDYSERVKKNISQEAKDAFNDLKDILDEGDNKTLVDGFYFPKKAVDILNNSDKSHHLNSYMDLTISNILNLIEDNNTIEEAIDELFNDYKADSAFSWADNFIEVLKKLDFDVQDEDELEEYDDKDDLYGYEESKKVTEDFEDDDMEMQHQANLDIEEEFINDFVSMLDNAENEITFGGDFENLLKDLIQVIKDKANASGYPLEENKKLTESRDRVAENLSKFIYDLTSDKDNEAYGYSAWSGNEPTTMGNGVKVYEVYKNGKSTFTLDDIKEAVMKEFPELKVYGSSKSSIFFYKSDKKTEDKKITESEEPSYKDMSTEDLDAYMTDIINKREGTEDNTEVADYLDQLYMDVDNEIQRRKETESKKIVEGTKVWSSESEYVDQNDPDFKEWLEEFHDVNAEAQEEAENLGIDPNNQEEMDNIYDGLIQDYLEMYNENDNEAISEDWNENILPMIERQLDDNDLVIMLGTAQTWRGTGNAGKVLRGMDDFKSLVADYDIIEFETSDDESLSINLIHHDGTHRMALYTFNGDVEGIYNKLIELGVNEFTGDDYEDFDDAYSYYDAGDFIDYMLDGHQAELQEFLIPIRWDI